MPKKYAIGQNPNSHNNKPKLGVEQGKITLTPEQWAIASQLGDGVKSLGLRKLIDYAISHDLIDEVINSID